MTTQSFPYPCSLTVIAPHVVTCDGLGLLAVCPHPDIAARLAVLFERHGLADVPDTVEGVV